MAVFERDGARIHYEVHGEGFPVLALAPGGLRSRREAWNVQTFNPVEVLAPHYQVIVMDQRNAGESWAPISAGDGWSTYTDDQLALLDELGIERFAVLGMCIGGAFIMSLIKAAPERVAAAVMLQPIGYENNRATFLELATAWQAEITEQHPEANDETFAAFASSMFGGDFMFSATRDEVAACEHPLLVLMGNDIYHPESISREIARLAPNGRLIEAWKAEPELSAAKIEVKSFFSENAV